MFKSVPDCSSTILQIHAEGDASGTRVGEEASVIEFVMLLAWMNSSGRRNTTPEVVSWGGWT